MERFRRLRDKPPYLKPTAMKSDSHFNNAPLLRVLFLCLLAMAALTAYATAAVEDGFTTGNRLYESGDYAGAKTAYEKQVRHGAYSANLFYNLAGACYRLGDRGRAILNYQRALILDPDHPEAAANLAFVRGGASGGDAASSWLNRMLGAVSIDAWCWLAAATGWLGIAGLIIGAAGRKGGRGLRWTFAGAMLAACAASIGAVRWLEDGPKNPARAIVVVDQAQAMYAPADNSKIIEILSPGREVRVLAGHGAWVYVRLADGKLAWMPSSSLERVIPSGHGT
jgi:tetratricopeptide (TPR) repeat protein